jgi:hypothetical protein
MHGCFACIYLYLPCVWLVHAKARRRCQIPQNWIELLAVVNYHVSRAWWCTPLIPALGRQRQADLWVRGQPGLQSEFQDSQGYTEKPCLEKLKKQTNKKKPKKQNKTKQKTQNYHVSTVIQIQVLWKSSQGSELLIHLASSRNTNYWKQVFIILWCQWLTFSALSRPHEPYAWPAHLQVK